MRNSCFSFLFFSIIDYSRWRGEGQAPDRPSRHFHTSLTCDFNIAGITEKGQAENDWLTAASIIGRLKRKKMECVDAVMLLQVRLLRQLTHGQLYSNLTGTNCVVRYSKGGSFIPLHEATLKIRQCNISNKLDYAYP